MPTILERRAGEHRWYAVCVEFPSAFAARTAWEQMDRKLGPGSLGIYRHGPADDPGRIVSAVSLSRDEVRKALRFLRAGSDYQLDEETLQALILRRARVVLDAAERGIDSGRLKWRRPEDAGAVLDKRTGEMIEPRRQG